MGGVGIYHVRVTCHLSPQSRGASFWLRSIEPCRRRRRRRFYSPTFSSVATAARSVFFFFSYFLVYLSSTNKTSVPYNRASFSSSSPQLKHIFFFFQKSSSVRWILNLKGNDDYTVEYDLLGNVCTFRIYHFFFRFVSWPDENGRLFFFFAQLIYLPSVASWSLSIRYMYLYATVAAPLYSFAYKSNRFLSFIFWVFFFCATGWKRSVNVPSRNAPISLVFVYASEAQSAAQLLMVVPLSFK